MKAKQSIDKMVHQRSFVVALLCGFSVLFGFGAHVLKAQDVFPRWFFESPRADHMIFAVGYAGAYADWSAAMEEATEDARERLERARRSQIDVERLYYAPRSQQLQFKGAQFNEHARDSLEHVAIVDSAQAGGMTLVLAAGRRSGTGSGPGAPTESPPPSKLLGSIRLGQSALMVAPFADPPAWVSGHSSAHGSRLQAVGIAPRYYYQINSWKAAERHGRQQLAYRAVTRISELERGVGQSGKQTVTAISSNVELVNVEVRARWFGDGACYVLVEAEAIRPLPEDD